MLASVLDDRVEKLVAALNAVGDHAVHTRPDAHPHLCDAPSLRQLRFGQSGGAFALAALAGRPHPRRPLHLTRGEYVECEEQSGHQHDKVSDADRRAHFVRDVSGLSETSGVKYIADEMFVWAKN